MLTVTELESGYGAMQVLWKPSLTVDKGTITSILGPNGAGKSTLLLSIFGTVPPWSGQVVYNGRDVSKQPTHRKVGQGLVLVPEGRHLFPTMTVYENLMMGAFLKSARAMRQESIELVYSLFPRLEERHSQLAGLLSGGEQQMVTIGRAIMTRPQLIMLDEPSQGLAPKLVAEVFETIVRLKDDMGLTMLLVEQNADASLKATDYVYVMHEGTIKAQGTPAQVQESAEIREAYLGM
jgi:branched-chain amino acid transport system ATP-binding protein